MYMLFSCFSLHVYANMACTPLKELNVSVQESPKANSTATIEITNYVLRKLNCQDSQVIDEINLELKLIQLNSTERLLTRLKNEISRSVTEYRKLKSGHQKTKFDKKNEKNNSARKRDKILQFR